MATSADLVSEQWTLYCSSNPTRRWLHGARRAWITDAVRRFAQRKGRAVEIGPGSGIYIPMLKEVFFEVYVVDCERVYLEPIEARYAEDAAVHIELDDITASRLPEAHFDLVLCSEVVEHIPDSRAAFLHIARILKPGGILVLSTPQRYSFLELTARVALSKWLIWLARLVYRETVLEMGHINLMTDTTVQAQLAAAGLEVIARHKGGLYLPGIAEFLGVFGQRIAARLECLIRNTRLDGVLWTQYYIAGRFGHETAARIKRDSGSLVGTAT
ncbi:class I SAM-dependent methyltransferase [Bradyrhizobium sp. 14AA]